MENTLSRLIAKARGLLKTLKGHQAPKGHKLHCLLEAIHEGDKIIAELRDPYKDRHAINVRIVRVMILLGEGGLFD